MLNPQSRHAEQLYQATEAFERESLEPRNAIEWARLQLGLGAAAADASTNLGLSVEAGAELTEQSLIRAQTLSVVAQNRLKSALEEIANLTGSPVIEEAQRIIGDAGADIIDLTEYRRTHHPDQQKTAKPKRARVGRPKQEKVFFAEEKALSDVELADTFFPLEDESQRASVVSVLAQQTLQSLSEAELVSDNMARSVVVLLRIGRLYKDYEGLWVPVRKEISDVVGLFLERNQKLIEKLVSGMEHASSALTMEDLVAEGQIGMMEALGRFDLSSPHKVVTFVSHRVHGAAVDATRGTASAIKMSRLDMVREKKIKEGLQAGKSMEEIADYLGVRIELLEASHKRYERAQITSFEAPMDSGEKRTDSRDAASLADVIPDSSIDVERAVLGDTTVITDIEKLIEDLPKNHQKIVRMRFGYPPVGRVHTLQEIADEFGFTESRACQIMGDILDGLYRKLPKDMHKLGITRRRKAEFEERLKDDLLADDE